MGVPKKREVTNSVAALLISTPLRGIQIGGSAKAGDQIFNDLQRPLLNVHSAALRLAGMLMT